MQFLWFLLIGLAAGWLSGQITKGRSFGVWNDLMVGVIGAILGGVVFWILGLKAYGLVGQLVTATAGSLLLLFLLKRLGKR